MLGRDPIEQLVENMIREIKPQVVMVELDAQRVGSFLEEAKRKVGTLTGPFCPVHAQNPSSN